MLPPLATPEKTAGDYWSECTANSLTHTSAGLVAATTHVAEFVAAATCHVVASVVFLHPKPALTAAFGANRLGPVF